MVRKVAATEVSDALKDFQAANYSNLADVQNYMDQRIKACAAEVQKASSLASLLW